MDAVFSQFIHPYLSNPTSAVRYGRVPKRSRDHSSSLTTSNNSSSSATAINGGSILITTTSGNTINNNNHNSSSSNNAASNNGITNINNNNLNHINRNTVHAANGGAIPASSAASNNNNSAATAATAAVIVVASAAAAAVSASSAANSISLCSTNSSSSSNNLNHRHHHHITSTGIDDHLLIIMPTSPTTPLQHQANVPMMDAAEPPPPLPQVNHANDGVLLRGVGDDDGDGIDIGVDPLVVNHDGDRDDDDIILDMPDSAIVNSNNNGLNQLTSVYDVIRLIGDGHLMFCTYVDELMLPLQRTALEMPNPTDATAPLLLTSASSSSAGPAASCSASGGSNSSGAVQLPTNDADHDCASAASSPASASSSAAASPVADVIDLDEQRVWLWQQCAARITTAVQHVVEFAKRIPGFVQFTSDDQLILIKVGFFEVWLAQVTRMGLLGGCPEAALTFDDGCYVTAQQLARMYNVSLEGYS